MQLKGQKKESKDISFEAHTLNSSYQDAYIEMESCESSLQDASKDNILDQISIIDPVSHFKLDNYSKYIKPQDIELLR